MTPETSLSALTFNIGNPSRERAERQLAWLATRPEQVLLLTETAASKGCDFLAQRFSKAGYTVTFPEPERGERGVMIVSRLPLAEVQPIKFGYLPHRAVSVTVESLDGPVEVLGLYIPSRDASPAKTERKRRFLEECQAAIPGGASGKRRLIMGDFNILEPGHVPRYPIFKPFEYLFYMWLGQVGYRDAFRLLHPADTAYSWVGRTGDGYRYDHAFVACKTADSVTVCAYDHGPRTDIGLTDHSALSLQLDQPRVTPLLVSDPTAAQEAETLF